MGRRTYESFAPAWQQLKEEPGQDIVQYGFGAVSMLLMQHGLLDELRLWIHPLFVGKGATEEVLFPKGPPTQFELVDSAILKSSIVILAYGSHRDQAQHQTNQTGADAVDYAAFIRSSCSPKVSPPAELIDTSS